MNAQGEDVVSGVRTPIPINELEKIMPEVYHQLREITTRLEQHYKDVQDFEFTIQDGKLYMLQTRNGKAHRARGRADCRGDGEGRPADQERCADARGARAVEPVAAPRSLDERSR